MEVVEQLCVHVFPRLEDAKAGDCAMLAWALAKLQAGDAEVVHVLSEFQGKMDQAGESDLVNAMWAMSSMYGCEQQEWAGGGAVYGGAPLPTQTNSNRSDISGLQLPVPGRDEVVDIQSVGEDVLVKFMKYIDAAKPSSLCTVLWGAASLGCFEQDFW